MKYLLNWNDEYLDMRIVCGPMGEEAIKQEMKKTVVERLVGLHRAKDTEEAENMYLSAEDALINDEVSGLDVSSYGASILYGGYYEDRYLIVDYEKSEELQGFINKSAELEYLKNFVHGGDFDEKLYQDQLRSLWTAYCFHHNLTVDTQEYDNTLLGLWNLLDVQQDAWMDYDTFDSSLCKFLV